MAKSNIINFRLKDAEIEAVDRRAEQEGMSRSNFIRHAINLALQQSTLDITDRKLDQPSTTNVDLPTKSGPQCITGKVRGCQAARWVRTANRQKQCQVCGVISS